MLNFLPLTDIYLIKNVNRYYNKFIDTCMILENYYHSKDNEIIIKKIIIYDDDNIHDNNLIECNKLHVLDLKDGSHITDDIFRKNIIFKNK